MNKVLLNFTPFLGDLFLMRGVAGSLYKYKNEQTVAVTHLLDKDIYSFFETPYFELRYSKEKEKYNRAVVHNGMNLNKILLDNEEFIYVYTPTQEFLNFLNRLIKKQIKSGVFDGITKVYSLHMQFEVIYLGYYLNKNFGIPVEGFTFKTDGRVFILNQNFVWHNEGIIKLMEKLLGVPMKFDFFTFGKPKEVKENKVLLLPDSRVDSLLANQYWDLAEEFFKKRGFIVNVARYKRDYNSLNELFDLIQDNKIIMTNDSFPYHLAWSLEKDIIVVHKAGVNGEWEHRPYARSKIFSIPSSPMYEEEFIYLLQRAIEKIS